MTVPAVRNMRDRVGALIEKLPGGNLERHARAAGFANLSQFMEAEDPSEPDERRAGMDAFTRCLAVADIRTASDAWGTYYAHPLARMGGDPTHDPDGTGRALFPEWARRQWNASRMLGRIGTRAPAQFLVGDYALGTAQRPYEDDAGLNDTLLAPAIPLPSVLRRTRTTTTRDFRSRYLTDPVAGEVRMLRVAEAAEIPKASIAQSSRSLSLPKFGRALEASYEQLRETPIDDFADYIRVLSIQTEVDEVNAAVDAAINGDGNSGTSATVSTLTALDPATTANTMTLKAWMAFKVLWENPYQLTAIFARQAEMVTLLSMNVGTANTLAGMQNVPGGLRTEFTPINGFTTEGIRYGITTQVAAGRVLGLDTRRAIDRVIVRGSEISESDRWITRQTEVLTFSVEEGFAVADVKAARILNLTA